MANTNTETERMRNDVEGQQPIGATGQAEPAEPFDPGQAIEAVSAIAREHPHAALAGAALLGFVLGGGLTPRLIGAVGMIAARRYLQQSLRSTLDGVLKEQLFGKQPT